MPTDIGEHLVGAYLELACGCNVISYDHALVGEQGDIDVLGLDLENQSAYAVEVKTHLGGLGGYGGQPGDKLRQQVLRSQRFLETGFPKWTHKYSIWSPHVTPKMFAQVERAIVDLPPVDLVVNDWA